MIEKLMGKTPQLSEGAAVHPLAYVAGDVKLGKNSSVFPGASLRGDENSIVVGESSNIQDNATLHTDLKTPVILGDYVTVGHNAIVHSATVGDNTVIGMGAIVLDRAVIGKNCIIGAGTVIPPNKVIPDNSVAVGNPYKIIRTLSDEDAKSNRKNAEDYVLLSRNFSKTSTFSL